MKTSDIKTQAVFAGVFAVAFIGCIGAWLTIARLQGAVVANGEVRAAEHLVSVQHRDGGSVRKIHVSKGQTVEAGDPLIDLDDVQLKAQLTILRQQLAETLARKNRLVAQRERHKSIVRPERLHELTANQDQIMDGESRLFLETMAAHESEAAQYVAIIAQTRKELDGLKARMEAKRDERNLILDEFRGVETLFNQQQTSITRIQPLRVQLVKLAGEIAETMAAIARTEVRLHEGELKSAQHEQALTKASQQELRSVEAKIAELQEQELSLSDKLSNAIVRAPVAGIINEMHIESIGNVLLAGGKVAMIVPQSTSYIVEARVTPADISRIATEQSARLRFTAFDKNQTPELDGNVARISSASILDTRTGETYFLVQVNMANGAEAQLPSRLLHGMRADVFFPTEDRSALSFFLKPILDQFQKVFRER